MRSFGMRNKLIAEFDLRLQIEEGTEQKAQRQKTQKHLSTMLEAGEWVQGSIVRVESLEPWNPSRGRCAAGEP